MINIVASLDTELKKIQIKPYSFWKSYYFEWRWEHIIM